MNKENIIKKVLQKLAAKKAKIDDWNIALRDIFKKNNSNFTFNAVSYLRERLKKHKEEDNDEIIDWVLSYLFFPKTVAKKEITPFFKKEKVKKVLEKKDTKHLNDLLKYYLKEGIKAYFDRSIIRKEKDPVPFHIIEEKPLRKKHVFNLTDKDIKKLQSFLDIEKKLIDKDTLLKFLSYLKTDKKALSVLQALLKATKENIPQSKLIKELDLSDKGFRIIVDRLKKHFKNFSLGN